MTWFVVIGIVLIPSSILVVGILLPLSLFELVDFFRGEEEHNG